MSVSRSTAGLLAAMVISSGFAGCDGDDDASPAPAEDESPTAASTCVTAGSDSDAMQLMMPSGFVDGSDDSILDAFWARPAIDGTGSPDVVGLDAYDRETPDHAVLQRAMAAGPVPPDSGVANYDNAVERVAREHLTEVSWTAPNRDGSGSHTGYVALEHQGETRFTVTIVASTNTFKTLKSEVLSTLAPGDCTG